MVDMMIQRASKEHATSFPALACHGLEHTATNSVHGASLAVLPLMSRYKLPHSIDMPRPSHRSRWRGDEAGAGSAVAC